MKKTKILFLILFFIYNCNVYCTDDFISTKIDSSLTITAKNTIIRINPITSLDKMSKEEIADFRIERVKEYLFLNLFPANYNPLAEPHNIIYGKITSGAEWIHDTQFYICNPYILIVVTRQQYINTVILYCEPDEVIYSNTAIEEIYSNRNAEMWFEYLFLRSDTPGKISICMVNAYDAGFFYANIDLDKSLNIKPFNNSPTNIANSIYSNSSFYHFGRKGKNNISPYDENALIDIIENNTNTCVYVKLWRKRPADKNQKEDFAYIIKVIP